MKLQLFTLLSAVVVLASCDYKGGNANSSINLNGTWQLITGITITKGVSVVTDYTKNQRMIKVINDTHFGFFSHGVGAQRDSVGGFDAGGGSYTLIGNKYTERLEYYKDKAWENKTFNFTLTIKGDTLIQQGLEKVEKENINRIIIEKYVKLK